MYRVQIRKEALKFSSAHMTVFADGTKERLHGHNYRTEASLEFIDFNLSTMVPFSDIKSGMKKICDAWDEKFFLPMLCPHLKVQKHDEESVDFKLCGKRYVIPTDEIVMLPVDNITAESLAKQFSKNLLNSVHSKEFKTLREFLKSKSVLRFELKVEEITGQGASFSEVLSNEKSGEKR